MFPDKHMANIAMDISINQVITEELPRVDPTTGEKMGVFIEDFPELKLKKNESSFYYYNELMKAKDKKTKSSKAGGCKTPQDSQSPDAQPGNGNGTSGSSLLDQMLDNSDKIGDWHSMWRELTGGMSDKERDLFKKEIQEQVKRVAEETQKLKGDVPVHISNAVKEDFGNKPPVISWKTLFNRFVGSAMTTDIYQTRKRPNFRFEDAPSNKYKSKIRIVVGCDTSGSVSDDELQEFFGQIHHMWKSGVKVDICLWDASCEEAYEYKGERKYRRTKCGGTRASCFLEYVNDNKNKKNWTCAITLTDGYIESNPVPCSIPMLWVITNSGSTDFEHKSKKIKLN